ncbi:hypothetical protein CC86DRAFT_100900 [Ophiobolus disseminans]|uniref:Peptidase S8/S53 domain-containing protein n=1 Tax=Ophiobolus disseminans TaxID=1469910 RepID=A0A6A6ZLQ5_9PLEO|nr:hypothetical protein CC86DRAFT_100900 [Ophiobolus disseminans]
MRLILLLLLCTQSVISAISLGHFPDSGIRDSSVIFYTVFPIDSTHAAETARTEASLKELCGDANVRSNQKIDDKHIESWTIKISINDDLAAVGAVEGVHSVQPDIPADRSRFVASHPSFARRDIQYYSAVATLAEDVQATEEFLKSKIQSGTEIRYLKDGDKVVGWWRLALDAESRKAVKNFKGIRSIRVGAVLEDYHAIPSSDRSEDDAGENGDTDSDTHKRMLDSRSIRNMPEQRDLASSPNTKDGVLAIEHEGPSKSPTEEMSRPEVTRRDDFNPYVAMAKDGTDAQKTEEFLRTKVQSGVEFYPYTIEDRVVGWYGLRLTAGAKEEIEKYEDIKVVKLDERAFFEAESEPEKTPTIETRDPHLLPRDIESCSCFVKNTSDIHEVEEFLKSKIQSGSKYYTHKRRGKIFGFWSLALDSEAQKIVSEYKGIEGFKVGEQILTQYLALRGGEVSDFPYTFGNKHLKSHNMPEQRDVHGGGLSRDESSLDLPSTGRGRLHKNLQARAGDWVKQTTDDKVMKMISQYPGADLNRLTDFVYKRGAGEGVYIYLMDRGVQFNVKNKEEFEFRHIDDKKPLLMEALQTARSKDKGHKYYEDDDEDVLPHGTGLASRAAGKVYGIAKRATIIPVKLFTVSDEEFSEALGLIEEHISSIPGRQHKSIVMSAIGWKDALFGGRDTPEEVRDAWDLQVRFGNLYKDIINLGVPVVCAAGNEEGQTVINSLPQLFESDDIPLIVVGAAESDGSRIPDSQGGDQLTVYAPGSNAPMQSKTDDGHFINGGTSLATPHVAGLIATYLSYDQKPWDDSKTSIDRVKEIKRFITSKESSWERKPGINVIWNGATEEDHKNAGANGLGNAPAPAPKTKAISIIYRRTVDEIGRTYDWVFYPTPVGVPSLCKKQSEGRVFKTQVAASEDEIPPWPAGTFSLEKNLIGEDCDYKNDGKDNPGMLWCRAPDGKEVGYPCNSDNMRTTKTVKQCSKDATLPGMTQVAVVFCEW